MSHPVCPYCGVGAVLTTGATVYPHRPDLRALPFFRCPPCDAHVGCHPGTRTPLGSLANAALRKARAEAHAAFDPHWKADRVPGARKRAYAALARELGMRAEDCHIGRFSESQCARAIVVCQSWGRGEAEVGAPRS